MAIYEYLCPRCRQVFEIMRPMTESAKSAKCPTCNEDALKLISTLASTHEGNLKTPDQEPFRAP